MKRVSVFILFFCFLADIGWAAVKKDEAILKAQAIKRDSRIAGTTGERVLRIGMLDCVAYALKNNSDIKIQRIDPKLRMDDEKIAKAEFEPDFSLDFSFRDETVVASSVLQGAEKFNSKDMHLDAAVTGKLETGTEYAINFYNQKYQSDSVFQDINPYYAAEPMITITQPLFKNFGTTINRAGITITKNNSLQSDESFRNRVMEVITSAKNSYYRYVYALQAYNIAKSALLRAQELLHVNKERYAKGLISSVDLLETEAAASDKEKAVIFAEYDVSKAQDQLKLVTNLIDDPDVWNARIELIDRPDFSIEKVSITDSLKNAFTYRPDYSIAKIDLKNRDIKIAQARNELFPQLDLVGSFGMNGLGADYAAAIGKVNPDYQDWSAGFKFSMPWGGAERAAFDQKKLEKAQALLSFKRLEDNIILEVRDRVRQTDTGYRQIVASRVAREKETQNYAAQKERYVAGQVSTHDLLDYQDDLSKAELDYIQSLVGYKIATFELERSEGLTLVKNDIKLE